jgi:hypothetical protein
MITEPPAARPTIPGVTVEPAAAALAFAPPEAEPAPDPFAILNAPGDLPAETILAALPPTAVMDEPDLAMEQLWYDPLAVITRPSIAGSDLPIRNMMTTTRQGDFARLTAPNISNAPYLLTMPDRIAAGGFLQLTPVQAGHRFAGAVIAPVPIIDLTGVTRLAQAQ